jgi:hypothetical protein
MSKSDNLPDDAMDIDSNGAVPEKPKMNGINLDDLKNEAPFKTEGLDGVDDLKSNLPFESKPATHVKTGSKSTQARLRMSDFPQPPKPICAPALDRLTDENWKAYVHTMNDYLVQWDIFETRMIEHFRLRREHLRTCMNEHWISMPSDGPAAEQIDQVKGSVITNGASGLKAGYAAYMKWLEDDEMCHGWWDRASEIHRGVMEELGEVRDRIMGNDESS